MAAPAHILVVDDEADLVELVSYNLKKEGFRIDSASDGESALAKIRKDRYDLLILDILLPGIQGVELCRIVRNDSKTASLPIIMLTAKGEETDRIVGLELGADDYVTKPFSPKELVARVKAVLRRKTKNEHATVIEIGQILSINPDKFEALVEGQKIELTSTEFRILELLASKKGWVFTGVKLFVYFWV